MPNPEMLIPEEETLRQDSDESADINMQQSKKPVVEIADRRLKDKLRKAYRQVQIDKLKHKVDSNQATDLLNQLESLSNQHLGEPIFKTPLMPISQEWPVEKIERDNILYEYNDNSALFNCTYIDGNNTMIFSKKNRDYYTSSFSGANIERNKTKLFQITMEAGSVPEEIGAFGSDIYDMATSNNEEMVALGLHSGEPHQIVILSTKEKDLDGKATAIANIQTGSSVSSLDFDPYSELIAASLTSGGREAVKVFSILDKDENNQPSLLFELPLDNKPNEHHPRAVKFSPDGSCLAVGSSKFRLLSMESTDEQLRPEILTELEFPDTDICIESIDFSPDGQFVFLGGRNTSGNFTYENAPGFVYIISLSDRDENGKPKIVSKQSFMNTIVSISCHPSGKNILVSDYKGLSAVNTLPEDLDQFEFKFSVGKFRTEAETRRSAFTKKGDKLWAGSGGMKFDKTHLVLYGKAE